MDGGKAMNVFEKIKESKEEGLTFLNLSNNRLASLSIEIRQLINLTTLNLHDNLLAALPHEIGQLINLTVLDLSNNQLATLSSEIGQLTNLTGLNLSNNRLTTLPSEIGQLTNLTGLNLSNNQLTTLPPEIGLLPNLTKLTLDNNPLQTPPIEIANQGIEAIRNYFNIIQKSPVKKLYESKLLIVGQGGVGKTTLAKKLIDQNCTIDKNESTTEGIMIKKYSFPYNTAAFTVNLWDFGGQEIYHATHQFFLTKRSFYLLVWEVRREEDMQAGFNYWLNVIRLLSENSPVILVLNKIDERIKEINQVLYKDEFKNIIDFKKISCNESVGIAELKSLIEKEIIKLPHIGIEWPEIWTEIRARLETDTRDYVEYAEYLNICAEPQFGLNETGAKHLSEFLHDLGVILHFQDDPLLRNIVILNPEWGTNAVYKVLDTKDVLKNNGKFHLSDLDEIWNDKKYPYDKHYALLHLMIKFELCFKLEGSDDYIVPELLSPEKPKFEWNYNQNLRFEYHYDFMPAGIITRFIVRQHLRIKDNYYWKDGVILQFEETVALIESDPLQKKITILIDGYDKKDLLAIVRNDFKLIHDSLNMTNVKEKMPCVCSECRNSIKPFMFNYEDVKKFSKKRTTIPCMNTIEEVDIEELFNGVEKQQSDYEYDFFISHASEDKDDIARPLYKALEKEHYQVWFDENSLSFADSLLSSIDKGLSKSRFGIVILSPNFLKKNWTQAELNALAAIEFYDGKKVILPLLHKLTYEDIRRYSPILAGKVLVSTEKGLKHVVSEIAKAYNKDREEDEMSIHWERI